MHVTHSYIGQKIGEFRCLFFLLLEDYIQAQTQLVKDLEPYLERFARNLGAEGAVVRPFTGDIETVKSHIFRKNWNQDEITLVGRTPGLLMINKDFNEFDPRKHPWVHIGFWSKGPTARIEMSNVNEVQGILEKLVNIVTASDKDIFVEASAARNEIKASDLANVFEAKPGIFGFSIDLKKSAKFISTLYKRLMPQHT